MKKCEIMKKAAHYVVRDTAKEFYHMKPLLSIEREGNKHTVQEEREVPP